MIDPIAMLGLIPTLLARYPINGIELPCRITYKPREKVLECSPKSHNSITKSVEVA